MQQSNIDNNIIDNIDDNNTLSGERCECAPSGRHNPFKSPYVYEKPHTKEPLAENPSTGKSLPENPSQLNTYKSNKDKLNTKDKDNTLSGERSVWECVINEECTDQPSGQSAPTTGQVAPIHDRASCTDGKSNLSKAIPDTTTEITNQRIHTKTLSSERAV